MVRGVDVAWKLQLGSFKQSSVKWWGKSWFLTRMWAFLKIFSTFQNATERRDGDRGDLCSEYVVQRGQHESSHFLTSCYHSLQSFAVCWWRVFLPGKYTTNKYSLTVSYKRITSNSHFKRPRVKHSCSAELQWSWLSMWGPHTVQYLIVCLWPVLWAFF